MEIRTNDYRVWYEPSENTIFLKGIMRLNKQLESQPIIDYIIDIALKNRAISIDIQELKSLNCSGINMLSKVLILLRNKGDISVVMRGSNQISWQFNALNNLQSLMPKVLLEMI